MKLESIKNLIKKAWSQAPSMASRDLLEMFHSNPRLDGVRIIANKCASTELFLYGKNDYRKNKTTAEIIENHDIYNLLDNPCPADRELTGWTIRYFVFACYALVGEAYLLKVRKGDKVIALQPVAPSWVVQKPTETSRYWQIYPLGTAGGKSIFVPVEDVICFKDIDLNDPYGRGRGTAETIGDEIQSDEYASKYAKNLFFNDATPSAIIYAPNGNKETADQIKKTWMQKMAGVFHAKEPMVLTGEGSRFEKISQTPTELDFVESRKFLRDVSLQQFHIPPEITGIIENSNRATIDSAFYLLNKNVLADYLRMFERVINNQLLWEDFDRERKFILHHENTIGEDIELKLRIANDGLSRGVLTVNDWRTSMGFGRDEKGGDVYLRGMGQVEEPFNSDSIELPENENTSVELPNVDNSDNPENNHEGKEYSKTHKILKSDADKERRKAIWKTFDARATSIEEPFKKAMIKAFDKQNELVNNVIKKACEENKDVGTAIENLFDNKMDESLKHTLASAFINGLTVGAEHGNELLNKKSVKEISDNVRRMFSYWLDNYGLELCKDMNQTTKKRLRKALTDSIDNGEDLRNQVKALLAVADSEFAENKKVRATLIARTESCATMNAGAMQLYKAEGINYKEWISVQDDRTRDSHLLMDGVVVPTDEPFDVPATSQSEGCKMDYAGDPLAPPSQICNCRCTVAPYVMM